MASSQSETHVEGTASHLQSENHSDLTITTQDRSFKVHKEIICTQSKVLAAMSEAGFKETSTAVLALEHDHPAAVKHMVTFLYTGDYAEAIFQPAYGMESIVGAELMLHALIYSLADKYDIQGLKQLAENRFVETGDEFMCEDFPAIVAMIFDTTPENDLGLRAVLARICAKHVDEVLASDVWNDLLANDGAIGLAILKVARENSIAEVDNMLYKIDGDIQSEFDRWDKKKDVFDEKEGTVREALYLYEGLRFCLGHYASRFPRMTSGWLEKTRSLIEAWGRENVRVETTFNGMVLSRTKR